MSERVTVGRIVISTTGPAPVADHIGGPLHYVTNEVRELRQEVDAWKSRFKAIVDADTPATAGNAVLHLMDRIKRYEQETVNPAYKNPDDHHAHDRGRMARTIEQTREHINSDHPCCVPVGDAVWMLHAYDELKLKYEAERQSVDILDKNLKKVAEYIADLERYHEALLNTIHAGVSPWLRKVHNNAHAAYKTLRDKWEKGWSK